MKNECPENLLKKKNSQIEPRWTSNSSNIQKLFYIKNVISFYSDYLELLPSQSFPNSTGDGTKEAHAQQKENNLKREENNFKTCWHIPYFLETIAFTNGRPKRIENGAIKKVK